MENVNCNLCHSQQAAPIYDLQDYLLEKPAVRTTLVKCQQCGLVYQNPRPTLQEIGAHYPPEYESYDDIDSLKKSPLKNMVIDYGLNKRCRFITRHKARGRLLDIGCASGTFLNAMKRLPGWDLHGVEISPHAARIASEKYGLNVFEGTLEDARYEADFFDAITLWDVLEHLHDPASSLQEIRRILKPDGILVFRVPNGSSWDASLFGKYWSGLDSPRHLYIFDKKSLPALLDKTGFKTLDQSCGIGSYPTFVLSVRFWLVGSGAAPQRRNALLKVLSHPIARLLSAPFFYISNFGKNGPLLTVTAARRS